jgi:hypothetical protein
MPPFLHSFRTRFVRRGRRGAWALGVWLVGTTEMAWAYEGDPSLQTAPARLEFHGAQDVAGVVAWQTQGALPARDVTDRVRLVSSDTRILQVGTDRRLRPVGDGTAELWVVDAELGQTNRLPVVVQGAAAAEVPDFRREIEPLLTRLGCNQGACHGKLAGQNGFRLSLRGYAPELDHTWITQELAGRRINPASPDDSLLVTKPLGVVPHEGLVRFAEGSRYHRTLTDWIAARAPGPGEGAGATATAVEVFPGRRIWAKGSTQQLLVQARWADGRVRDVTWLAQFFSNDEVIATVTPEGLVEAKRSGETVIRAHFQGLVSTVRVSVPYPGPATVAGSIGAPWENEPWRFGKAQNAVDEAVFAKLRALNLSPSPRCDDATFLRRAMLDTLGMLPTVDEVQAFLADRSPDKRTRVVDQMLERPEFADYWTLQLADLFQNRKERDHDVRGTKGVRSFHAWLHDQVAANTPWDVLVRRVLSARGSVQEAPEGGYYVTLVGEKTPVESEVTDSVAQAFLGTRIGCARCHNHPLERYTQDDFYQFAAFFSRLHLDRKDPGVGATELVGFSKDQWERARRLKELGGKLDQAQSAALVAGEAPAKEAARRELEQRRQEYARVKREQSDSERRPPAAWQPRLRKDLPAQALDREPLVWNEGEDPRAKLADWVTSTNNLAFRGALVNRLWRHFLGVGLVEPVDDLRASNPPSNQELWDLLGRELVSHGHDWKHVMRLILNSRTYQLSAASTRLNEADRRFYSHYYARRLPAEVLADAISVATDVPDRFEGYPVGVRSVQLPEPQVKSYFLGLFGRSERVTACACERNGEVTLPQLLHLQNGAEIGRKLDDSEGRLHRLVKRGRTPDQIVTELYLATLSRPPTPTERAAVLRALEGAKPEAALTDLLWALLNTKEFAFNH